MTNIITVTGNVATEPVVKVIKNGQKVMEFCFANNLSDKETNFFNVTLWQESIFNYVRKGRLLTISGKFKIEKYTKKDGTESTSCRIFALQVDFVDNGKKEEKQEKSKAVSPNDFTEDDIPF